MAVDRRELGQLFAFDRWANRQTLAALRSLPEAPPAELPDLLWHVLAATDNWLSRIDGSVPFEALGWEQSHTVGGVGSYLDRLEPKTIAFIEAMTTARLGREFEYQNTSGETFTNVVGDALQHVILHGVEHRAQIMYAVGALGGQPAELEYAWFLREPPPENA
jgi:uncharacterized damage-inducible protein DinB